MAMEMIADEESITTLSFCPLSSFTHIGSDYIFSFFNNSLINFWCENLNDYPVIDYGGSGEDDVTPS